ncbi:hypothetical protein Tco_1001855, partial [Tanacetum coccineum]
APAAAKSAAAAASSVELDHGGAANDVEDGQMGRCYSSESAAAASRSLLLKSVRSDDSERGGIEMREKRDKKLRVFAFK